MIIHLKNVLLWLLAALLATVLYFVLKPQSVPALPDGSRESRGLAPLMEEKQRIEEEMNALQKEIAEEKTGPSLVFLLFSSLEEEMLKEAIPLFDAYQHPALIGVSESTLAKWQESGLPTFLPERLEKGWELCLIVEEAPAAHLQKMLASLSLPRALCALSMGTGEILPEDGIALIFTEGKAQEETDACWHVLAIGNMNRSSLQHYQNLRSRSGAIAYIIGSLRPDQEYSKDQLHSLLSLLSSDRQRNMMLCLKIPDALMRHDAFSQRLAAFQQVWDVRQNELNQQLQQVIREISRITEN